MDIFREHVKARLLEFIKFKGPTVKAFEHRCGMSNGYVAAMRKGIGGEKLKRVFKEFPELNQSWLLNDYGTMLENTYISESNKLIDIRAFRNKNNLTQKELADYLGTGKAFISFIEHGRCKLPPRMLDIILDNDQGWDTSMFVPDLEPENWIVSENTYTSQYHDATALKRVGLRIDEICNIKNIQQQFLAENIGLDYKKLVNIIAGNEPAPEQLLLKILATYADINPCWLCLGVGKPYKV